MTTRTQILLKRLLTILNELDAPTIETILQAEVGLNMVPTVRMTEFDALLAHADSEGYLISIEAPVTKRVKWSISDKGRAALQQL